jgi:hypothetical protein
MTACWESGCFVLGRETEWWHREGWCTRRGRVGLRVRVLVLEGLLFALFWSLFTLNILYDLPIASRGCGRHFGRGR